MNFSHKLRGGMEEMKLLSVDEDEENVGLRQNWLYCTRELLSGEFYSSSQ